MDAWVIATNKSFAQMGWSADRNLGMPFGANVVLPVAAGALGIGARMLAPGTELPQQQPGRAPSSDDQAASQP